MDDDRSQIDDDEDNEDNSVIFPESNGQSIFPSLSDSSSSSSTSTTTSTSSARSAAISSSQASASNSQASAATGPASEGNDEAQEADDVDELAIQLQREVDEGAALDYEDLRGLVERIALKRPDTARKIVTSVIDTLKSDPNRKHPCAAAFYPPKSGDKILFQVYWDYMRNKKTLGANIVASNGFRAMPVGGSGEVKKERERSAIMNSYYAACYGVGPDTVNRFLYVFRELGKRPSGALAVFSDHAKMISLLNVCIVPGARQQPGEPLRSQGIGFWRRRVPSLPGNIDGAAVRASASPGDEEHTADRGQSTPPDRAFFLRLLRVQKSVRAR